jgi:hypothetical protein
MIYEIRVYNAKPGKMGELYGRFRDHTLRLFPRHGINVVGVFNPEGVENQFWYMTKFADEDARKKAWAAFQADSEWAGIKKTSEAAGPLMESQTVTILHPTESSPRGA